MTRSRDIFGRPDQRGLAPVALVAAALLVAIVAGALNSALRFSSAREAAQGWQTHTYQVLLEAQRLQTDLSDAETGQRGFLLIGDPAYLRPYSDGVAATAPALGRLRQLTRDNGVQQANLDRLARLVDQRIEILTRTVDMARAGQRARAIDLMREGRGKILMDAIRVEVAGVLNAEQRLLAERGRAARDAASAADWYLFVLSIAGAFSAIIAGVGAVSWGRANRRIRLLEAVREAEALMAQSEEKAARALALVAAIGEATSDLMFAKDRDGRMLYANPSKLAVIGRPSDEVLGRSELECAPNQLEAELVLASDQAVLAAGASQTVEERVTHANGEPHIYRSNKTPLHGEAGQVIGLAVVSVDITHARAAEEVLRASEARFRTLSETIPAFIFLTDPDGQNTYTNSQFQDFTGKSADELLGAGWVHALHPDDRDRARATWNHAWRTGQPYKAEYRFSSPVQGDRWHVVRGTPLRGVDGDISQWVGACIDMQELFDVRDQLSLANAGLESQVAARTLELEDALVRMRAEASERTAAEAQLRQMQKVESIGQLTGGIAHDFNNMLAIIIGALDLAKRRLGEDPARVRLGIEQAEDGARRAAELTAKLLAFSRQQALAPARLDLNALVTGMTDLLRRTLGEQVRIETVLADELWPVHADASQLENALLNLCVNARDAMPNGGTLTIETSNTELDAAYAARNTDMTAGQFVLIGVSDTGSGMPPEVIERAFDPFFTTKAVGKGTGLGLSQVHGFVKQTGGHIKIYSEAGHGTSLKIYLPRHVGPEAELERPSAVEGDVPLARPGEVILVVEDEPAVRDMVVEALQGFGYTVIHAIDGREGLAVLAAEPDVDLLFTDIVMPHMHGGRLAEEALKRRPDLKILYSTGYARSAAVSSGVVAAALITKPFTLDALARKVRSVLDGATGNNLAGRL